MVAVLLIPVNDAFANHPEVAIGTVEGSGFAQDCAAMNGGSGCYTPTTATVDVNGVVTMTNTDETGSPHTFTSGTIDGFAQNPSGVFDSGILMAGETLEWTATETGTVPYYCMLHVWMIGEIIVQEDSHAAAEAAAAEAAAAEAAAAEAAAAEAAAAEAAAAEAAAAEAAAAESVTMDITSLNVVPAGVSYNQNNPLNYTRIFVGGTQSGLSSHQPLTVLITDTSNGNIIYEYLQFQTSGDEVPIFGLEAPIFYINGQFQTEYNGNFKIDICVPEFDVCDTESFTINSIVEDPDADTTPPTINFFVNSPLGTVSVTPDGGGGFERLAYIATDSSGYNLKLYVDVSDDTSGAWLNQNASTCQVSGLTQEQETDSFNNGELIDKNIRDEDGQIIAGNNPMLLSSGPLNGNSGSGDYYNYQFPINGFELGNSSYNDYYLIHCKATDPAGNLMQQSILLTVIPESGQTEKPCWSNYCDNIVGTSTDTTPAQNYDVIVSYDGGTWAQSDYFTPSVLTINTGDTVTWKHDPNSNTGYSRIYASFTAGYNANDGFSNPFGIGVYVGDAGNGVVTFTHTFDQPGTYVYTDHVSSQCQNYNPDPTTCPIGTIVVADPTPTGDTTPPTVTVPSNISLSTPDNSGRTATFSVSVSDNVGVSSGPICSPSSGSQFPIGSTAVTCFATDANGNVGSGTFTVTVTHDSALPTVVASYAGGTWAQSDYFTPSVLTINVGDTVTWIHDPNSQHGYTRIYGSFIGGYHYIGDSYATYEHTFNQIGTYVYTDHVLGGCQNYNPDPNTCPVGTINVVESGAPPPTDDITLPIITPSSNLNFSSNGTNPTVYYSIPTATDNIGIATDVTCTPPPGSSFSVGTTIVECSVTDFAGNEGSASFNVTVTEDTGNVQTSDSLIISVPPNFTAYATNSTGQSYTQFYQEMANNPLYDHIHPYIVACDGTSQNYPQFYDIVGNPEIWMGLPICDSDENILVWSDLDSVGCSPAYGTLLPIGLNTITCTATDTEGNTGSASFTINVIENTYNVPTSFNCHTLSNDSSLEEAKYCLQGNYQGTGGGVDVWDGIHVSAHLNTTSPTGRTLQVSVPNIQDGVTIAFDLSDTSILPPDFITSLGQLSADQTRQYLQKSNGIDHFDLPIPVDHEGTVEVSWKLINKHDDNAWASGNYYPAGLTINGQNIDGTTSPITIPALPSADHPEVAIVTVDESGFSQTCAESQGGPGCYTPITATVEVGGVVTMTNTDETGIHHIHLHQELLTDLLQTQMEYLIQVY